MNVVFFVIFIIGGISLLIERPESFFSSLLDGGQNAVELCLQLIAVYAISMGIMKIVEDTGLIKKLSKLFAPINRWLFDCQDKKVCGYISANFAANMLGMGGAATAMGLKAMQGLKEKNSDYSQAVFFTINAAGFQILPLSVIALRICAGSKTPSDIIIPCTLSSIICLLSSLILITIFIKRN